MKYIFQSNKNRFRKTLQLRRTRTTQANMRRLVRYMILAGRLTTELDRLELPSMARPVPTGGWRESPLIACCQLGPAEQLTRGTPQ